MKGYIKLYRKLLCNPIFKNPYLLQLFVYCLLKANHSEGKAFYGADEIILKPGQFVTGRFELSAALGGNASSTYKRLKRLESLTMLGLQSNNKNTLVTVLNWESYQIDKSDLDNEVTADGQESNRKVTTKGQQSNTNKNVKNDKNVKKDIIYLSEEEAQLIKILEGVSNYPLDREKEIEMLKRLSDKYSTLDIISVVKDWAIGKIDKPLKKKDNPRSQINTWCKNADAWGKNKKEDKHGTDKQHNGEDKKTFKLPPEFYAVRST